MTVIIKECGTCTQRKHYEAGSDNENLSWAFVDGTTFDGDSKRKAVEIVPQNHSHVEIHINHIATKIIISRRAAFLAVSLLIPEAMIKVRNFYCVYTISFGNHFLVTRDFTFVTHF